MKVLDPKNIITGLPSEPRDDAIRRCGHLLADSGYVGDDYIEGMVRRNRSTSVAIGNAIAIPHGENADKDKILHTGLCVLTYPDGIDWDGQQVKLVIGIAAQGDEHMDFLVRIAETFADEAVVHQVCSDAGAERIYELLGDK
ncbi:MAG: PTS sugar transporter subunit IIA [Propionibacteriaceae bacterium]|jgi:mannitol/fructose-specific phosphotransferase system IIA component|nr:PTS sugar transporter subunit IIA [Propionibacteriaceae bacterium]